MNWNYKNDRNNIAASPKRPNGAAATSPRQCLGGRRFDNKLTPYRGKSIKR